MEIFRGLVEGLSPNELVELRAEGFGGRWLPGATVQKKPEKKRKESGGSVEEDFLPKKNIKKRVIIYSRYFDWMLLALMGTTRQAFF